MNKYPKINYIGNKAKLVDWIIENLPVKKGVVLDIFSGGSSVSYALKNNNYQVLSNDVLYSNYVISKAIIENNETKLDDSVFDIKITEKEVEKKYKQINFLSNRLYFDEEVKELAKLICISEKLEGYEKKMFLDGEAKILNRQITSVANAVDSINEYEKYMFLALIRRAMIRKLPYSRMNVPWNQIVKLRDEEYSYMKYKRKRAYHNYTFEVHMRDNLKNYNDSVFDNGKNNISYNYDSFEMLKNLKDQVDIIYMDPPYPKTMNKYGEFYGLFDTIFEKEKQYIDFSANDKFLENMEKLIKDCIGKTKYIVISQSNKTSPSVEEMKEMLSKYGQVTLKAKDHQYKVTGKDNKNTTVEVLIIVKLKNEI